MTAQIRFTLLGNKYQKQGREITLDEAAAMICSGEVADILREYDKEPTPGALKAAKEQLPALVTSGTIAPGERTRIAGYNSLVQLDYDHLEPGEIAELMHIMAAIPHTALAFVSPSGKAVKCFALTSNTDPGTEAHYAAWESARRVYADAVMESMEGWYPDADPATKDPVRLCFLSADPYCFHNANAVPLAVSPHVAAPQPAAPRPVYTPTYGESERDRAMQALQYLAANATGLVDSYPDYLRFVFACVRAFGRGDGEAEMLCRDVCRHSQGYNEKDFTAKWNDKGLSGRNGGPSAPYLFRRAVDAGWKPARRNVAHQPAPVQPASASPVAPPVHAAPVAELPFIALGYERTSTVPDYVFFSNVANLIIRLSPAAMTEANLLTLAPKSWWEDRYFGQRGFDVKAARSALIEHGNTLGIFKDDKIRGRGIWLDAGRVVIHTGDMLIVDGKDTRLGRLPASRFIYEIGEELELSLNNPLIDEDAARFLQVCHKLKWDKAVSARLLAGWCVIAPLSGLLTWRPHIWISGPAGSGKSWVQSDILRPALGNLVAAFQGNSTEPGVRRSLSRDALPVAMDEMEGNGERETEARIAAMMELARGTSSQDSGGTAKANQTGGVDVQQIKSCFSFASIVPQIKKRADFRRFTLLTLRSNEGDPNKDQHFKELAEAVHTLLTKKYVAGLQARTLANVKLLGRNIETFSQAVSVVLGERGAGDQLGPMLAGAEMLESLKEYTLVEALAVVRQYETDFRTATKSMSDEDAIVHFLSQSELRAQSGSTTVYRSVAELVDTVLHGTECGVASDEAHRALKAHGIAVRRERDGIAVSASHIGTKKLLEKTTWAASHVAVLSRVAGAKAVDQQRFGVGNTTKAVVLPLDVFTPGETEAVAQTK